MCELPNEGLVPTKAASDAAAIKEVTDTSRVDKNSSVSCIENTTDDENEEFKEIIDNGLNHVDTESENEGQEIVEISQRNSTGSLNIFFREIKLPTLFRLTQFKNHGVQILGCFCH